MLNPGTETGATAFRPAKRSCDSAWAHASLIARNPLKSAQSPLFNAAGVHQE